MALTFISVSCFGTSLVSGGECPTEIQSLWALPVLLGHLGHVVTQYMFQSTVSLKAQIKLCPLTQSVHPGAPSEGKQGTALAVLLDQARMGPRTWDAHQQQSHGGSRQQGMLISVRILACENEATHAKGHHARRKA